MDGCINETEGQVNHPLMIEATSI